ncbi:MAG: MFS transporter [Candidatus Puniceispirillaceae bacterium]
MKTLLSISALLFTIMLMQMGTTALGPLDTLSAIELGFSNTEIGVIGGSHFLGFLIGCLGSPLLVKRVGHARAYCVTAALSIVAILLHPVVSYFWAWCVFRVITGIAIATSYTSVESWLNAKLTNSNRSRFFGIYRIIDMTGALVAQAMISVLVPAYFLSYTMLAILVCLSLLPLGLTKSVQPAMPETQKINVFFAFQISPLAALGVLTVGATGSALRMIGPLFAYELAFTPTQIGIFLSLPLIAGMIIQMPIGFLAERATPRQLIGSLSMATIFICVAFTLIEAETIFGIKTIFILVFIFGLTTMPLYSLSAIHANNQTKEQDMTMLSASLIFLFGVGAIISPVIASYLIEHFGPNAMFTYFAVLHILLLGYTAYRARIRPLDVPMRPYIYIPRTSLFIAKTIKSLRRRPHKS